MAFFLEAGFLGVLLFGRKLVPPWAHFVSAVMVAVGTLFSAFWILVANSWMQTPAGFSIVDGRFFPIDWIEVIFNPSFPYRFTHTVMAVYLTTAFTVIGVAAWYLRGGRFVEESRVMITMGLGLARPGAAAGGAGRPARPQHAGAPAAEARGDRRHLGNARPGQPAVLFAIPDEEAESNRMSRSRFPSSASFYLHARSGTAASKG